MQSNLQYSEPSVASAVPVPGSYWDVTVNASEPCSPDAHQTTALLLLSRPWPLAVPVPGYWWDAAIGAPVTCPVASYCLGGSRAAAAVACGGNMTSAAGSTAEIDCVPLPGFYGAPAQLSPPDHYSAGGSRTAAPVACGANLLSPAGSAGFTDCGEHAGGGCILVVSCGWHPAQYCWCFCSTAPPGETME